MPQFDHALSSLLDEGPELRPLSISIKQGLVVDQTLFDRKNYDTVEPYQFAVFHRLHSAHPWANNSSETTF